MNTELLFERYWDEGSAGWHSKDKENAKALWMLAYQIGKLNTLDHGKRCCVHQCHYGDDDCPVTRGLIKAMPCEYCGETR